MVGFRLPGAVYSVKAFLASDEIVALICGVVFSCPIVGALDRWLSAYTERQDAKRKGQLILTLSTIRVLGLAGGMFLCALQLASGTHNPFIYFRF
jgi:alginate O-acetyltransferase complex protein AlgI